MPAMNGKRDLGANEEEDLASFKRVRIIDRKPVSRRRSERKQNKDGKERSADSKYMLKAYSSYWSVPEVINFIDNVAYFGTDWLAIANHMGTKTPTMVWPNSFGLRLFSDSISQVRNHYMRLIEGGMPDLMQVAAVSDQRRERGQDLGPRPRPLRASPNWGDKDKLGGKEKEAILNQALVLYAARMF